MKKTILFILFVLLSSLSYADITTDCTNVTALYHFDGDVNDSSGNGNDGTCSGTACPTWNASGKIAGAFEFDGVDDTINAGSDTSLDNIWVNGGTWSVWVYPLSYQVDARVISKGHEDNSQIVIDNSFPGRIEFRRAGESYAVDIAPLNTWTHIAITFNDTQPSSLLMYVNGVNQTWTDDGVGASTSSRDDSGYDFYIGSDRGIRRYFNGYIDEVIIYNKALSQPEITELYNSGNGVSVSCGPPCVDEDINITCGSWVCGNRLNNCSQTVSCPPGCTVGEICNSTGSCIIPIACNDIDEDGYGATGTDLSLCSGSTTIFDCDDTDITIWQGLSGYVDSDLDGFGAGSTPSIICSGANLPSGYSDVGGDCRDDLFDVNPNAIEGPFGDVTCSDGLDNDCAGGVDSADAQCQEISGNIWPAASCSQADVTAAYSLASDGDTIMIPAGACTWSSTLTINSISSRTKMVKLIGAGTDTLTGTRITCNARCITAWLSDSLSGLEIANIRFIDNNGDTTAWAITIMGHADTYNSLFRIYNNYFDYTSTDGFQPIFINPLNSYGSLDDGHPYSWGLIDNNTFKGTTTSQGIDIYALYSAGYGNHFSGIEAWEDYEILGGQGHQGTWRNVIIEDNVIDFRPGYQTGKAFMDCVRGGTYVFRHNTVYNSWVANHGVGSNGGRSCKWMEIYDNDFVIDYGGSEWQGGAVNSRGGTAVYYSNKFYDANYKGAYSISGSDTWEGYMKLQLYRASGSFGTYPCNSAVCGDNPTLGCDNKDITSDPAKGWICMDQPGAAKGSAEPTWVYGYRWESHPIIAWDNNYSNPVNIEVNNDPPVQWDYVKEERDYINTNTCSDGIDNDGDGLTDMQDLECINFWDDTNNKKLGYTPYTYPHPLRTGNTLPVPTCNDGDNDGYGNPASSSCTNSGLDCNDNNPSINPGATETCNLNIDDNCDGIIQCHNADYLIVDGCVDENEVDAFVQRWFVSSQDVSMSQLISAIRVWKAGCN